MALCPECGGKVAPVELLKLRPGTPVRCRWCRAYLRVPVWSQCISVGLFCIGSGVAAFYLGMWYLRADNALPLVILAGMVLGLALLAVLIQWVLPLHTIVPRDYRDWKAAERAEAERDSDGDASPVDGEEIHDPESDGMSYPGAAEFPTQADRPTSRPQ